jgi:hypothetical protein
LEVALPLYALKNGQPLPENIRALLWEISPAAIDRLLAPVRQGRGKLGLATGPRWETSAQ